MLSTGCGRHAQQVELAPAWHGAYLRQLSVSSIAGRLPLSTAARCRAERQYATFSALDACNYAVNIYDDGNIVSIVTDTGEHGTHVTGITAAHHPDNASFNGVAPGAQVCITQLRYTCQRSAVHSRR